MKSARGVNRNHNPFQRRKNTAQLSQWRAFCDLVFFPLLITIILSAAGALPLLSVHSQLCGVCFYSDTEYGFSLHPSQIACVVGGGLKERYEVVNGIYGLHHGNQSTPDSMM